MGQPNSFLSTNYCYPIWGWRLGNKGAIPKTKITLRHQRAVREKSLRMKTGALLLSFIICGLGLTFAFVLLNPFGLVIDSLGFLLFPYAISSREKEEKWRYGDRTSHYKRIAEQNYKCGSCLSFGKPGCKR